MSLNTLNPQHMRNFARATGRPHFLDAALRLFNKLMTVEIPEALISAIAEQRAVLFLGAGASKDAIHSRGANIQTGAELRDVLCDRFLGGKVKDRSLSQVAELAINETSLDYVQLFIAEVLKDFEAAPVPQADSDVPLACNCYDKPRLDRRKCLRPDARSIAGTHPLLQERSVR